MGKDIALDKPAFRGSQNAQETISIKGAREHNLKNLSLSIQGRNWLF